MCVYSQHSLLNSACKIVCFLTSLDTEMWIYAFNNSIHNKLCVSECWVHKIISHSLCFGSSSSTSSNSSPPAAISTHPKRKGKHKKVVFSCSNTQHTVESLKINDDKWKWKKARNVCTYNKKQFDYFCLHRSVFASLSLYQKMLYCCLPLALDGGCGVRPERVLENHFFSYLLYDFDKMCVMAV